MYGLEFMEPLIADMTEKDPTKRPTMEVVVSRFDGIRQSLSNWKLRSRAVKKKELGIVGLYRSVVHSFQLVCYVLKRTPPVPNHLGRMVRYALKRIPPVPTPAPVP